MNQTFESLTRLSSSEKSASVQSEPQQHSDGHQTWPLSFAQERVWFLDQLEPGTPVYNLNSAVRFSGRLNMAALQASLEHIMQRHGVLRTSFPAVDGLPAQVIAPSYPVPLSVVDLEALAPSERETTAQRWINRVARQSFDLARGPLWRVVVLHLSEQDHLLLVSVHHIIFDGWSRGVFFRELWTLYEAFCQGRPSPLPPLPMQYADYAVWQRQWLQGEVLERQLAYWKRQLAGAPVLALPTDRPRPPVQTYRGARCSRVLSPTLHAKLKALCRQERVTLFMLLLAAFQALLHRYTGQDDICVGTFVANRDRAGTEGLLGFFMNNLVLRTDLSGNPPFRELLARVREVTLGAYTHQDLPFEKLLEELQPERDPSRTPLFQVMLVLQNMPRESKRSSLRISPYRTSGQKNRSNFDLTLWMSERTGELTASLEYNTDLFDASTIARMLDHFEVLLSGVVADPGRRLSELPVLSEEERRQLLVKWNEGGVEYEAVCVHQLVERQAQQRPEAIAVVYEQEHISYGELVERARRLARWLRGRGVGPEVRVGVCMERGPLLVVGLLGVLKAGGAYVPLDPGYPVERLGFMVQDSGVVLVLTQESLAEGLASVGVEVVSMERWWQEEGERQESVGEGAEGGDAEAEVRPDNLAYIIYTSGSTGRPKGVMVSHGAVAQFTQAAQQVYGIEAQDRVLQFASLSFDASVEEIYPCLSGGATLVMRTEPMGWSFQEMLGGCQQWAVTVVDVPTIYWHELVVSGQGGGMRWPACVRLVIIGGERAMKERVRQWWQQVGGGVKLVNTYGPTEATVVATVGQVGEQEVKGGRAEVTLGRPLGHVRVYVLDGQGEPVPVGVVGELYIGGCGLARGYVGRPEMTAEVFIPDRFSGQAGGRLYRTGDLVRWRQDGQLEYVGRRDEQVKVRGYRVEPGEVEAVLSQHPGVQEAVVVGRQERAGGWRLVAYVVAKSGQAVGVEQLRQFVSGKLPAYMVPAGWVMLPALPRLANGKVDRRGLPEPGRVEEGRQYEEPQTALEAFLVRLWQEVLQVEEVGVEDNFFQLGGNSLKGAVMINRVQAALGVYVYVVAIFEAPTIRQMAGYLSRHYGEAVARVFGRESVVGGEAEAQEQQGRVDAEKVAQLRRQIRPLPARSLPQGEGKNRPVIFILSPPRSGSTLLRVMLGGHRRLFAPPELYLLMFNTLLSRRRARQRSPELGIWDGPVRAIMELRGCSGEQAWRMMEGYEEEGLTVKQFYGRLQEWLGERVLVDKSIFYALNPWVLRRAEEDFAEPWYIHLVRHPYGMIRSFEEARLDRIMFRHQPFSVRQLAELIWVISHENILEFLRGIPQRRQHRVKFEELVTEPRAVMQRVCEFLGLAFDAEMLEPYKESKKRMTDGVHEGSRMVGDVKFHEHRGIEAQVAERWKEVYREDFLGDITWQLAESLGYERRPWVEPAASSAGRTLTPLQPLVRSDEQLLAKLDQLSPEEVRSLLDKMLSEEGIEP